MREGWEAKRTDCSTTTSSARVSAACFASICHFSSACSASLVSCAGCDLVAPTPFKTARVSDLISSLPGVSPAVLRASNVAARDSKPSAARWR